MVGGGAGKEGKVAQRKDGSSVAWVPVLSGEKGLILGKVPLLCHSFRSAEDSHSFLKKDLSDYKSLKALLKFPFKGLKGTHK